MLSVLMPVYSRESPSFLECALSSVAEQSVKADEVVIVKDGPLTDELERVIDTFSGRLPLRTVALERNAGLGPALQRGVLECQNDLIGRMDADDICLPTRFEKQLAFLEKHPEIDVLGGSIAEFKDDPALLETVRRLPKEPSELAKWAIRRNPMNHMTVMFRRSAVIAAGNYQPMPGFEDYFLWARMLMAGSKLANVEDTLVLARSGTGMLARRGGLAYANEEMRFQYALTEKGFISYSDFAINVFLRLPVRLIPTSLRARFYSRILRVKARPVETVR